MTIAGISLALIAALAAPLAAQACTCADPRSLQAEFGATPTVVEADFVSATISLSNGEPIEDGVLRVRTSFKGPFKPGELIRTRSNISGAACGHSLRGTPPTTIHVVENGRAEPYFRWGAYDRWVLFLHGRPPFAVSSCSRSKPTVLFDEMPNLLKLQRERQSPSKP